MLDNLTKRVAWAIEIIPKEKKMDFGITDVDLAKVLGTNKNTLAKYRHQKGTPKGEVIDKLVSCYKFNPLWLFKWEGEPFPGAHDKYPEVCGPPGITKEQEDHITSYIKAQLEPPIFPVKAPEAMSSSDQKINIEEAMGKAYKVLLAGTALSVALYMNIQQFAAALDTSQELRECKDQIIDLQAQINDLRRQVDRITAPPHGTEGQGDGSEKEVM